MSIIFEQGEDDGHQWFRILSLDTNLEISTWQSHVNNLWTSIHIYDDNQKWKGPYTLNIPEDHTIELLDKLQKFIDDSKDRLSRK